MEKLPQYESGEDFERYLGDPLDPARQLSFRRAVEEDEQEVYPEAACAEVENWGLHQYYAPEQAQGKPVDGRADLFSLGVVLYRMTTSEMPFVGTDAISTLLAIATAEPPAPSEVRPQLPVEVSNLIMRLLEKDPARRPESAEMVAWTLRHLEKDQARASTTDISPQQMGDVVEGGGRQHRQRLGLDGEHVTAVEPGHADMVGGELAVGRGILTVRKHFLELEIGHGCLLARRARGGPSLPQRRAGDKAPLPQPR